ncbi:hypothetical protein Agabi119p4_44 [Agaricus bisporus var. burnettii]|uniref:MARVEL domain-containing protein n=1 Tax=Agaricus bisporus var. burnettii TaxID=192524 RepID=A0A8H7KKR6_AGABI|nr:hypothetical protein Agabi119p4_44 [Agaricus bisporus var. burnettii]
MSFDKAVQRTYPFFFGFVFVFGVITLSISGWLVSRYENLNNFESLAERDRVRYFLFVSAWTVLLTPIVMSLFTFARRSKASSVLVHLVFLFITWVIWIAGASALTQTTGGGMNCSTNTIFNYCGQLNALIAFGYINWILLTFIFAMCILLAVRSWKRGDGLLGSLIEIPIEEK